MDQSRFDPYCISITFNGNAQSCRGITWYTDEDCASDLLLVTYKQGGLTDFKHARLYQGTGTRMLRHTGWESMIKEVMVHQLTLTDLQPDTSYAYKVGDRERGIWSQTGTFHTTSQDAALRFIVVADSQGDDAEDFRLGALTLKVAKNTIPDVDFLVHMGDFVESYTSDDSLENFAQWQQFFTAARPELMQTTILPVAGNHDMTKNVFTRHFLLDKLMPAGIAADTGAYYVLNYGNACFIVLNSNEGYQQGDGSLSEQQIAWLKKTAASADRQGVRWKILLLHRGIYSFGRHMDSADIISLRSQLAPIISDLKIDLVLQGHDHIYMRSRVLAKTRTGQVKPVAGPIECVSEDYHGQKVDFTVNPPGTTYITPNVSGNKFGFRKLSNLVQVYPAAEYHPEDNDEPVFAGITIDGNRLIYRAYVFEQGKQGQVKEIDRYAILKRDDHNRGRKNTIVSPGSFLAGRSGNAIGIEELRTLPADKLIRPE